jgi:hypothetical protein
MCVYILLALELGYVWLWLWENWETRWRRGRELRGKSVFADSLFGEKFDIATDQDVVLCKMIHRMVIPNTR